MLEKDLEIKSTNKQRRKLVDYYNQWREEKFGEKGYFKYTNRFDEVHLVSKKMGFIEWLVSKDKIDFRKLDDNPDWYDINTNREYFDLIALLSIQDNPIEFLLSILK